MSQPTPIAIAVVRREGRYLVGRRGAGKALAGMWEFPGGKVEPGETAEQAALRECREETGLEVHVVEVLSKTSHNYDHGSVQLTFLLCEPAPEGDWHAPAASVGGASCGAAPSVGGDSGVPAKAGRRAVPAEVSSPAPPYQWVEAARLAELEFPPANAEVLKRIAASGER